jgi:hypothetical protein
MLDAELLALRRALLPLKAYAAEARRTIDATDPKQARRFAHVQDVEAALFAGADLYDMLNPPPLPLTVRVLAHLNQPHLQERLEQPHHIRHALGLISAHHLPRPDFPDECRLPPQP